MSQKIKAELRRVREEAGTIWWEKFIEHEAAQIAKRQELAGVIYWEPSEKMPLDVFSYTREASLCLSIAQFLASIVLSSTIVEIILNKDRRTRRHPDLGRIQGWATLNNKSLRIAGQQGLPVNVLLGEGESLENRNPILFVDRRNKVAHGDIAQLITQLSGYDPNAAQEALDQLGKSDRFVVEWFNTAPDVQECHIKNHQWPDT